jgi:hypothetical protein
MESVAAIHCKLIVISAIRLCAERTLIGWFLGSLGSRAIRQPTERNFPHATAFSLNHASASFGKRQSALSIAALPRRL